MAEIMKDIGWIAGWAISSTSFEFFIIEEISSPSTGSSAIELGVEVWRSMVGKMVDM